MGIGLLHTILNDITGHKAAPVAAPQKSNTPTLSQFTQAMINTKPQDIPMDNLDGTYTNLQPGKGAVVAPEPWHPPLRVGVEDHSGLPYFTPLSGSAGQYTDDSYYRMPINPNVVPQPMQLLKPMLAGQIY